MRISYQYIIKGFRQYKIREDVPFFPKKGKRTFFFSQRKEENVITGTELFLIKFHFDVVNSYYHITHQLSIR